MIKKGIVLLLVILSFVLGGYFEKYSHTPSELPNNSTFEDPHAERRGTGYLINPLLECELSTFGSNQKYIPFENDTKNRIQKEILEKYKDITLSLYFRNLRNGPWFGINSDMDFSPASLMKLPVTMAYMKWSEYEPSIQSLMLTGVSDPADIQNIVPEKSVQPGNLYSVINLIKLALIYSDNNANETLISYLPKDIIYKVFNDLNLPIIDKLEAGQNEYISVKEYSSFFRILYNASYLNDMNSSSLLEIMTHSAMTGGLRASIPDSVTIAHKFGERRLPNSDGSYTSQFHDCGIIYYEKYPYVACIMSKGGDDMNRLEKIVENTSRIIFDEISKRYH